MVVKYKNRYYLCRFYNKLSIIEYLITKELNLFYSGYFKSKIIDKVPKDMLSCCLVEITTSDGYTQLI